MCNRARQTRRTSIGTLVLSAWLVSLLAAPAALAIEPKGNVFESEAISSPKGAWLVNKVTDDHWRLWTKEVDIERKRSGQAVLASPIVAKDRDRPEDGAPPLHSVVTDLKPGTYLVYVSNPGGRPLAYSLDGRDWIKHRGSELSFGAQQIDDGRFELWVDDRYAHPPGNPGPGYYDYVRFVPVPASAANVERFPRWRGLERWLAEGARGRIVPPSELTDRVGFAPENECLRGNRPGDRFSYVFDKPGKVYLAVDMNDDNDDTELLTVELNGEEIGCLVADQTHGGRMLFSLKQPITAAKGDRLTFTAKTSVSFYRVYGLVLASEPIVPPPPQFENIEVWCPQPGRAEICWTTTQIVPTGEIEYRVSGADKRTQRDLCRGRCHRVVLDGLSPTTTYEARIHTEHRGKPLVSELFHFKPVPKLTVPAKTEPVRIKLTVPEPTKHARKTWWAVTGIPFAKGALPVQGEPAFELGGKPIESRCLSRWPDGSVKWALVGLTTPTKTAGDPTSLELVCKPKPRTGPEPHPTIRRLERSDEGWSVTTKGGTSFRIPKTGAGLVYDLRKRFGSDKVCNENDRLAPTGKAVELALTMADGKRYVCGPPEGDGPVIEFNGSVHGVVRWSGRMQHEGKPTGWAYLVRATAYPGVLRLNLSVWPDQSSPVFHEVRSLALHVPKGHGDVRGGFDGAKLEPVADGQALVLLQDRDNRFLRRCSTEIQKGQRAVGVAVAEDDRFRTMLVMRDFWQTYPSGLIIRRDGIEAQFLPPLPKDAYTDDESRTWFHKLYGWCKDGTYLVRAGQVIQDDVYLCLEQAKTQSAYRPVQFADFVNNPLILQASPEYLCGTGALGAPAFPRTSGVWDQYEACFDRCFENHLKDRERRRTFGWMHWGDWFGERYLNYGNNEYDLPWAMGVQWMRTGNRRVFDRGLQMARHYSTVDTIHGAFADRLRGRVWTHCYNHLGSPQPIEALHFPEDDERAQAYIKRYRRMIRGAIDAQGHIYEPGNFLYGMLTGERWLTETAEMICTHQARHLTPNFNFSIERSGGWPLINAVNAYAFTGNPYYLNSARIMIERCLERQDPESGGWLHTPPIGETDNVRVRGGKAFAVGILSHGILRYLEHEPNDRPDVRRMLLRGADWLINEAWVPGQGFRYITNAPNWKDRGRRGITSLLNAEVIAWAYQETKDQKYVAFWKDMMAGVLDGMSSGMGKAFTQTTRQTIHGLERIRSAGVTSLPKP